MFISPIQNKKPHRTVSKITKNKFATISLTIFILLSVVSIAFLYYAHATPVEKTLVTTPYTYSYHDTYNCVATLKPNTIYGNITSLILGEGSIYRRITDHVDINFTHTFQGSLPANLTIRYSVDEYVGGLTWTNQIALLPERVIQTTENTTSFHIDDIPRIDLTYIEKQIVDTIIAETGIMATQYSLNITTRISIQAETTAGTINEYATPTMSILFKTSSTEGDTITTSNLENTKTGEITETQTIYQPWMVYQRTESDILTIASIAGIAASAWFYVKTRPPAPPRPGKLVEETIAPFEEIVVEASEKLGAEQPHTTTINAKTLEDLAKIADTLNKPILHTYNPPETHIFRVIDGSITYEITMAIPNVEERKPTTEEDEEE